MAVVIIATSGAIDANSYVTLAEANTYFESVLHGGSWTGAVDDDTRNRALVMATKRIDQEDFYGDRETSTQSLKFPRDNLGYLDGIYLDGTIPIQLKEAQYELAKHLIDVNMNQLGTTGGQTKSIQIGSLKKSSSVDENDNTTYSYDTLPPFVEASLTDLSSSINSGGQIDVSR